MEELLSESRSSGQGVSYTGRQYRIWDTYNCREVCVSPGSREEQSIRIMRILNL